MRTHGAVVGRRFRSVTKLTTKVRIGRGYLWGSFLIAAAALKTPTRNGYNAQGVNLKIKKKRAYLLLDEIHAVGKLANLAHRVEARGADGQNITLSMHASVCICLNGLTRGVPCGKAARAEEEVHCQTTRLVTH